MFHAFHSLLPTSRAADSSFSRRGFTRGECWWYARRRSPLPAGSWDGCSGRPPRSALAGVLISDNLLDGPPQDSDVLRNAGAPPCCWRNVWVGAGAAGRYACRSVTH